MSRDLDTAARDCLRMLEQCAIPVGKIREIKADTRARRRWGVCRKEADGSFRIGISVRLLEEDVPLRSLQQTILHELLHTAPGCMDHTGTWKRYAGLLNRTYGFSIRRASAAEDLGAPEDPRVRYRFRCEGCGAEQLRYRACNFTRHPERYRCSRCGGMFTQLPIL